uniref:Uncharacterized protein n=1 Tax=Oryza rufipogon TaxID=4529 RepID=A0A0E0RFW2_ORYRU
MAIRKFMYENIQSLHKTSARSNNEALPGLTILDLAGSVGSWSKIHYEVAKCKSYVLLEAISWSYWTKKAEHFIF